MKTYKVKIWVGPDVVQIYEDINAFDEEDAKETAWEWFNSSIDIEAEEEDSEEE